MKRLLIVTALPQELDHAPIPHEHPVVFTGIGKLNAALTLMEAISKHNPAMVVNFGTAGRLSQQVSGLVEVGEVLQRDMDAEPLSPRGITPFDETPMTITSGYDGVRCGTGDSFMRATDAWLLDQQVDIVDMELFALALVCHRNNIPWRSFKYITDDTDENAGRDWMDRIHHGRDLFLEKLSEISLS